MGLRFAALRVLCFGKIPYPPTKYAPLRRALVGVFARLALINFDRYAAPREGDGRMSIQYYTLPETYFRMSPNQERQYNEIRYEARMGRAVVVCAYVGDRLHEGAKDCEGDAAHEGGEAVADGDGAVDHMSVTTGIIRYESKNGPRFRVVAANGEKVAQGTQKYARKAGLEKGITAMIRACIESAPPELMAEMGWVRKDEREGMAE